MNMEMITEGLRELLRENNYNPATLKFYEREWRKIQSFLVEEYEDTEYDMERGLKYLEKQYGFVTKYDEGSLSQQRVQLLRVVHMLEDYSLHKVLTRRYYASKNPLRLNECYSGIFNRYCVYLNNSELSASTKSHYRSISTVFMDYLTQLKVCDVREISMTACNGYLKTLAGYSFKTVEQKVCGIRHFLRYLQSVDLLVDDFAEKIHMPSISKGAKIPSSWSADELKSMIAAIDRNNPIGKRDYAMIVLACVLGLRVGDIKSLRFRNFDWDEKRISLIQNKTHKPLTLPLPDAVSWAVIDYIKSGRPKYHDTDVVFLKHMPPFDAFSDNDHLGNRIKHYMQKAGINRYRERRSGFHSLRHSAGSMLLEMETPLPVITSILGHSDSDITAVYLKTDLEKLAECILLPEDFTNEQ
jgi:site-specific recombinase XerD